jgi:adenylyl- and sulfurtransferase ThiI
MSESNESDNKRGLPIFPEWFKENCPREYYFYHEIQDNINKICSKIPLELSEGEFAEIMLKVTKLENNIFRLATNPYGIIFLGTLGKVLVDESNNNLEATITDVVKKEVDSRFSVKCKTCDTMNPLNAKYCNNCSKTLT